MVAQTVKNLTAMRETLGSIPELERSGEGNGYPFQYSCLENFMDRGPWWATVHRIPESCTWLSGFQCFCNTVPNWINFNSSLSCWGLFQRAFQLTNSYKITVLCICDNICCFMFKWWFNWCVNQYRLDFATVAKCGLFVSSVLCFSFFPLHLYWVFLFFRYFFVILF